MCVVKLLEMVLNVAARLASNQPEGVLITLLVVDVLWLPVAACIKVKALLFSYRVAAGSAASDFSNLVGTHLPLACYT